MNPVLTLREMAGLTQDGLARAAGTSQPTIAAYEAGRKSPTMRTVQRFASVLGLQVAVQFYPPLTREERRSLFLHRAVARHLTEDPERILRQAGRALKQMHARVPGAAQLLREWDVLLDRPLEALLPVLSDPSPWARELRHVTPFAGILSAGERAEVYRTFARVERRAS